jgi:rRNA maturation endonuclease Nob1
MGLFENLGRKVEKFKQSAQDASADSAEAICADCETLVYSDRDTCPECGSADLQRRESDEG